MADFISSLNGVQMDSALMDMAEHTSEAYAIGERNGVPVDSGDVTYHNNARYYAQQAQSIAPASVTEAVRWDVAQTALTDAQRLQARENIDAGKNGAWTNPNLLDNPWWGSNEVVNQRNTTSAPSSNGLYTIDRWVWATGASGNTWGISTTGITITIASSSVWYSQKNPNQSAINGKTVTGSVLLSDGTIYSGSATFSSGTAAGLYDSTPLRIYLDTGGNFTLRISSTMTIRAVKLELGTVSTLANDTPPDYGTELAKCQRYFLRIMSYGTHSPIAFGYGSNSTTCRVLLPTPTTMRALPTVTMTGSFLLFGNGSTIAVTSLDAIFTRANGVALYATVASGVSGNITYCLVGNQPGDYIDLSADL